MKSLIRETIPIEYTVNTYANQNPLIYGKHQLKICTIHEATVQIMPRYSNNYTAETTYSHRTKTIYAVQWPATQQFFWERKDLNCNKTKVNGLFETK